MADLRIDGRDFYQITGDTAAGRDWIESNVDGHTSDFGEVIAYSDDTGYAQDIAEGATADGLAVAVNGYIYLPGGLRGAAA